jgi:hypothetical protein
MSEREGISETGDLAMIVGLAAAGVTDYAASEFGLDADDRARTGTLLSRLAAAAN